MQAPGYPAITQMISHSAAVTGETDSRPMRSRTCCSSRLGRSATGRVICATAEVGEPTDHRGQAGIECGWTALGSGYPSRTTSQMPAMHDGSALE